MNPLVELGRFGQSVWLDNISRGILNNKELARLIKEDGIKGVTSNPTIFQKAIGSGDEYDTYLKHLLENNPGASARELFESIAVRDIKDAADLLMPVYEESDGVDGFVSIEVSPDYAYDTKHTIDEAARLVAKTGRPNVMIKIPATPEGIPAIREMISRGVSINVTLIFSPKVYEEVVEAYIKGLEDRAEKGEKLHDVRSVASFFISRIDTVVDKELDKLGRKELQGKAAIANAKLVYRTAKKLFGSARFKKLEAKGAKVQRLLWASTSTKNPDYKDTIYVDELIGPDTVNTMPPATITAFRDHGKPETAIEKDVKKAEVHMSELKKLSIDFEKITDKLTKDGVDSFADSFRDLLATIDKKKEEVLTTLSSDIKIYLPASVNIKYKKRLGMWGNENAATRLWKKDYTLWKENKTDDKELSNRLGWLDLPYVMQNAAKTLIKFSDEVRSEFSSVVVLGMGGSSLAPEVFFKTFGKKEGYPTLVVLDSTHPDAVKRVIESPELKDTLFVVSSKSGTTTETASFMYTAFDAVSKVSEIPGRHFIAVTDPGTILESYAKENSFRKIFITPAEVGGRYSALTFFGLLPAALIGVDVEIILNRAFHLMNESKKDKELKINGAFKLGAAMGELAESGKNKLVFTSSPKLSAFPDWIEQLVAESTGKEGKGILPVIEHELSGPDQYGSDSVIVYLRLRSDNNDELDRKVEDLQASGVPLIQINLEDEYDLGREYYRWEMATALAGSVMRINPFDQPNVQLAKTLAAEAINEFKKSGALTKEEPAFTEAGISVFTDNGSTDIKTALGNFFNEVNDSSYISIMAFIDPNGVEEELQKLSSALKNRYNTAVTRGFGPRFLHSTGQLHKGDANRGFFIQITSDIKNDLDVPGQGYSFGTLITAQAKGDLKALKNLSRRVIRLHFNVNNAEAIRHITSLFEQ